MNTRNFKYLTIALGVAALINACTPTTNIRGNMLQNYQLDEIRTGKDTQADVIRKLGSPTTKAPFDDNIWYYLGQKTEKHGILDPKVVEERVIVIIFNDKNIVQEVMEVDNQRVELPYARGKTPTSGHELTFLQQLLGNLGRFNIEEQ